MASERVTLTAAMLYDAGREDGRRDAAAEIARLTRELEEARTLIRELVDDEDAGTVWTGTSVVCAYCSASYLYDVEHDRDCPIERARRALGADDDETM